jgi:Zn-finger nucleic acid-binding protein
MRCCRCSDEMLIVEYAQIEIDYCPDCGIWLDSGELELVLAEAGSDEACVREGQEVSPLADDKPVRCPACRKKMTKGPYDGLACSVVDRCPAGDGVWLDRGELKEIIQAHTRSKEGDSAVLTFLSNIFGEED